MWRGSSVRPDSYVLLRNFSMGIIPKRYVTIHSVGLVHPHAKYVILSEISFLKIDEFKFLIDKCLSS